MVVAERKANIDAGSDGWGKPAVDKRDRQKTNSADELEYLADMILELQRIAARGGHHALAQRLLAAHELAARPVGR